MRRGFSLAWAAMAAGGALFAGQRTQAGGGAAPQPAAAGVRAAVAGSGPAVPRHGIRGAGGARVKLAPGVELADADLRRAQWRGTDLQRVVFTHVDLRGADLTGTDLRDACL